MSNTTNCSIMYYCLLDSIPHLIFPVTVSIVYRSAILAKSFNTDSHNLINLDIQDYFQEIIFFGVKISFS